MTSLVFIEVKDQNTRASGDVDSILLSKDKNTRASNDVVGVY